MREHWKPLPYSDCNKQHYADVSFAPMSTQTATSNTTPTSALPLCPLRLQQATLRRRQLCPYVHSDCNKQHYADVSFAPMSTQTATGPTPPTSALPLCPLRLQQATLRRRQLCPYVHSDCNRPHSAN